MESHLRPDLDAWVLKESHLQCTNSIVSALLEGNGCLLQVQPEEGQARLRRAADEAPLPAAAPQPELKKEK